MNISNRTIVIAGGGSGGHIFPAIRLGEKLREQGCRVVFFCSQKQGESEMFSRHGFQALPVPCVGLPTDKNIFRWIRFIKNIFLGLLFSKKTFKTLLPSVVVGMGGFVSAPVILCARFLKVPVLIHEQNVMPGRANLFFSNFADTVAIGIEEAGKYFKNKNVVWTGNPVREDIFRTEALNVDKKNTTILVVGGSQGSYVINKEVLFAIERLPSNIKSCIQVVHITGKMDFEFVRQEYERLKVPCIVFDFFDKIGSAYKAANFAICRAGAGTITELSCFALPAILIPHSGGTNHQVHNAMWLKKNTGCIVIEQKNIAEDLLSAIQQMMDEDTRKQISLKLSSLCKKDAASKLAKEVLFLCEPR